jgi:hypothetical protein
MNTPVFSVFLGQMAALTLDLSLLPVMTPAARRHVCIHEKSAEAGTAHLCTELAHVTGGGPGEETQHRAVQQEQACQQRELELELRRSGRAPSSVRE